MAIPANTAYGRSAKKPRARATFRNPVIAGAPGDDHGDPFVIKYLDSFYLYHTGDTSGRCGVSVHRSTDLVNWEFQGYAAEPAEAGWASADLWAPGPPTSRTEVEALQSAGRLSVRVGGVLRSSRPSPPNGGPVFASDGDVLAQRATSFLEDGALHRLPASSSYVWDWGGSGPLELSLAVKGSVELDLGGTTDEVDSGGDRYSLVLLAHAPGADEIVVRSRGSGATVTDLFVYARG